MYKHKEPVGAIALMVAILILAVLPAISFVQDNAKAETGGPVQRPLQGDWMTVGTWTIQNGDNITHSSKTILINGDLVIQNGGKLTLDNVKLLVNSVSNVNPLSITVNGGGELIVKNSNITEYLATNASQPDYFKFIVNGKLTIDNTKLSYLWGQPNTVTVSPSSGIDVINTDAVSITNCEIRDCIASGIYLGTSDAYVANNKITDTLYGIYSTGGDPTIKGNVIIMSRTGIHLDGSNAAIIRDNNVNNGTMGIELSNANIKVLNNTISNNFPYMQNQVLMTPSYALSADNSDAEIAYNKILDNDQYVVDIQNSQVNFHHNTVNKGGDDAWALINLQSSSGSKINNNDLWDLPNYGLFIYFSDNVEIGNNNISKTFAGIVDEDSSATNSHNNRVFNNTYGIAFLYCDKPTTTNDTIASSLEDDLYIAGTPGAISYNTSFSPEKVFLQTGDGTTFTVNWFAHVKLVDQADKGLPNYNLKLFSSTNKVIFNGKTDSKGLAKNLWATDYYMYNTTTEYSNPYHVEAVNGTYKYTQLLEMTAPGTYKVTVPLYQPGQAGDWIVNSTEYYSNKYLDDNFIKPDHNPWSGNLTVKSGGKLVLEKCTLEMQSTSTKIYTINVEYGGELVMRNGSIVSKFNSTTAPYDVYFQGKATLLNEWVNYTLDGIRIITDNVSVDRCNVPSSKNGYGVICRYSAPSITNSTITTSKYGIYADSGSPYIYNNELKSGAVGVYMDTNSYGTIFYNRIHNNGGNGIHLESASPLIKNNYVYTNGGNGIYVNSSASHVFANTIYDNDNNGIYFNGNSMAKVDVNKIYSNHGDGIVDSATATDIMFPTINDNEIYGNVNGISLTAASPEAYGNYIHNNSAKGLSAASGSAPTIGPGDIFSNNTYGLYFSASSGTVTGINTSTNTQSGIYLTSSSPVIANTSAYKNTAQGIYAVSGSNPYLSNCNLKRNTKGLELSSAQARLEKCRFDGNTYSVYLTSSSPIIGNSTFYSAITKHIYLSSSNPRSVNNTIPNIKDIYFSDPTSKFYYCWFSDAKVMDDKFNPMPNATVKVLDKTKAKVFEAKVDSMGYVWGLLLNQYAIQDNNNDKDGDDWALSIPEKTDYTPHNFTATCPGYSNTSKNVTMNTNYLKSLSNPIVLTMKKGGGGGASHNPPTAPTSIKPDTTHNRLPNITWSASTDYSGKGLKYHFTLLNESGGKVYNNVVITKTFYQLPNNLSYGMGYNTYYIELFTEDGDGYYSDTTKDTLSVYNTDPILTTVGNKNVTEGQTLGFTLSATDSNTGPVDTLTFGTNATYLTLNKTTGAISWTPTAADVGNHTVNLTVTDGVGGWDYETIKIWVKPLPPNLNHAPIASAGVDKTCVENESVTLNGSASYDPDNDTLTYYWDVENFNYTITFTNGNSAFPSFTPNRTGLWTMTLQVKDNNGTFSKYSQISRMNITVTPNHTPVAVIAEPANNSVYGQGETVFFNASGSSDVDGQILTYAWFTNRTVLGEELSQIGTTSVFNTSALVKGKQTITLKVTDTHGAYSNATALIEITGPANRAPSPKIASPVEDASFYKSEWINFDATGTTDLDGDTLIYTWVSSKDGLLAGNAKFYQDQLSEGEHVITLHVSDGSVNVSKVVNITVKNHAPLASFTSNAPKNIGDTVTFIANATSDPDGQPDLDNMTYTWTFGDGGTGSGKVATHIYSVAGHYSVNLNVSDGSASYATNETVGQVRINTPPIAAAGEDLTAMVGNTLQFDGTGSSDPDGDTITYKWDFGDDATLNGAKVSHAYANPGTFTVKLTVNDGVGYDEDTLTVTVKGAALAPIANAGEDRQLNFNETDKFIVAFDGSLSYDPADDINGDSIIDEDETNNLTYFWDFNANVDKNKDGNYTNDEEAKVVKPTVTYSNANDYVVTLTVKNAAGLESSASIIITMNFYPQPLITVSSYGLVDKDVSFSTTGSVDPDGKISTYAWDFGDGQKSAASSTGPTTHKYSKTGKYDVVLTATDNSGAKAEATTSVEVVGIPTPTIDLASGDVLAGKEVVITGSALNPEKGGFKITKVQISTDGGKTWTDIKKDGEDFSSWTYTYDSTKAKDGNLTIKVASYVDSAKSSYASVNVFVKNNEDTGGTNMTMIYIVIAIVAVIIIGGAIVFFVFRKKKGDEEEVGAVEEEEDGEVEVAAVDGAPQKPGAFKVIAPGAPAAGARPGGAFSARPTMPTRPAGPVVGTRPAPPPVRPKDQPIKCPKCKEIFIAKDDGKRPLKTKCTNCGAKGLIKGDAVRPGGPTAPMQVSIKCPKCSKIFKINGDEKYFECPKCETRGKLAPTVVDKLKENIGRAVSPLGSALAHTEKPEMESIRCPVCRAKFDHPADEKKIECPKCGAKGSL